MASLFQKVWDEYGPLVRGVIEASGEFVVFILILKSSRIFLNWAAPEFTCHDPIDCVHTGAFFAVWLILVLTFIVYMGYFSWTRFWRRARALQPSAEQRLEAKTEESLKLSNESLAISIANSSLEKTATFSDRSRALGFLEMVQEQLGERGLLDRRINLYLGRLNRQLGRIDDAIDVLSRFISQKEKRRQLDEDYADAHYNRACYHLLKMNQAVGAARDSEKELAYSDLEQAISFNPTINRNDAMTDEDFEVIRKEPRFKALVEGQQQKQEAPTAGPPA